MPAAMKIDFVSDISCPWCAIGLNALEQALADIYESIVCGFTTILGRYYSFSLLKIIVTFRDTYILSCVCYFYVTIHRSIASKSVLSSVRTNFFLNCTLALFYKKWFS